MFSDLSRLKAKLVEWRFVMAAQIPWVTRGQAMLVEHPLKKGDRVPDFMLIPNS
jgi:hypothetical protein